MDQKELLRDIRQLREQLKQVNSENKHLKQQLCAKQEVTERPVKKSKQDSEDERFVQELLHSYTGAYSKIKENSIEVSLKIFAYGVPKDHFVVILENLRKGSWKLVGYNLPISVVREQGSSFHSKDELCKFIREVLGEVQAFVERKYQFGETEKILEKVNGSFVWHSTKYQKILLRLPLNTHSSEQTYWAEIVLDYEVDHILPHEVTTKAEGLDERKLEKLRRKLKSLFMNFPLRAVIGEEFGCESSQARSVQSFSSESS